MEDLKTAKRNARAMKKNERQAVTYGRRQAARESRLRWLQELRCFWTWPFRHVWQRRVSGFGKDCVVCGAVHDPQSWSDY